MRTTVLLALAAATPVLAAPPAFAPADTAAIYKAAGFAMKGKAVVDCAAPTLCGRDRSSSSKRLVSMATASPKPL